MNRNYIMKISLSDINPCKEDEFIPYAQIYLGVKVLQTINDGLIQQKDLEELFWHCRKFLQVFLIFSSFILSSYILNKIFIYLNFYGHYLCF